MKRVYVDVVADLFHVGHINLFKKAKYIFDDQEAHLVVGVHSDAEVESYKRTPIIPQDERYEVVRSCKYVDEVVEAAPLIITEKFLLENNIDCVVHGDDHSPEFAKQHAEPLRMGIMRYVPYSHGTSTSEIIKKISSRLKKTKNT